MSDTILPRRRGDGDDPQTFTTEPLTSGRVAEAIDLMVARVREEQDFEHLLAVGSEDTNLIVAMGYLLARRDGHLDSEELVSTLVDPGHLGTAYKLLTAVIERLTAEGHRPLGWSVN